MTVDALQAAIDRRDADYDREFAAWEKATSGFFGMLARPHFSFAPFPKPVAMFSVPPMHHGDLYGPYPTPRQPGAPVDKMVEGDLYA